MALDSASGIAWILLFMVNAAVVQNYVLTQFFGAQALLGTNNLKRTWNFGLAIMVIAIPTSLVVSIVQNYILDRFNLQYLQILVQLLIITLIVYVFCRVIKKSFPKVSEQLDGYEGYFYSSSFLMGICLTNFTNGYNLLEATLNGLAAGFGYAVVLAIMGALVDRLSISDVPDSMKGTPIHLVSAGLISMAFLGFSGMIK